MIISEKDRYAYRFLSPGVVVLVAVLVIPLLYSLVASFMRWRLTGQLVREFTGLRNYVQVFSQRETMQSLKITLIFVFASVVVEMVLGILIAFLLNRPFWGYRFLRVAVLLPMMVSPAVIALAWRLILNPQLGPLNYLLVHMGLKPQVWLSTNAALTVVIVLDVWMNVPFVVLLVLAALQAVSVDILEQSRVDGANAWQRATRITLPVISPIIMVALVFRTMYALRNFPVPWVLTGGGPANATNVLAIEIYRQAFRYFDIGVSSAISWVLVVVTAVLSVLYIRVTAREALE